MLPAHLWAERHRENKQVLSVRTFCHSLQRTVHATTHTDCSQALNYKEANVSETRAPPLGWRKMKQYVSRLILYTHFPANSTLESQWNNWNAWRNCSVTCGTGFVGRDRDCENAGPGERVGPSQEVMSCSPGNCPGIHAKVNKSFKYQSRANPESHILQLFNV